MATKVGKNGEKPFLALFSQINSKKYCFYAFISGNSVFLRHIINEKNKRIMKELVEKVAALYADFSKRC